MLEDEKHEAISRIVAADNIEEALEIYLSAENYLCEFKIALSSPRGARTGFSANKNFPGGAAVRSLFKSEFVIALDSLTVREMLFSGKSEYQIDYSISLDTQAVSHLDPYISGRDPMKIDADLKDVFNFISRDNVFVDPLPYIVENFENLKVAASCDRVFEKLKAYEILRTLDLEQLQDTGKIVSTLSPARLVKVTQELIARLLYDAENAPMMEALRFAHKYSYVHLLKMVSIQLRWPKSCVDEKMERFAEFGDAVLATLGSREIALARAYFERSQNMRFFSKVQKGSKDLFKTLRNMAWDLSHIRRMELCMVAGVRSGARYFFPALLTFDKGLIEVLDLYPLKALAFEVGRTEPLPFFSGEFLDLVASSEEGKASFARRFYSIEARKVRVSRRQSARKSFRQIVDSLERELAEVAKCDIGLRV
jgi:hypothetical protein